MLIIIRYILYISVLNLNNREFKIYYYISGMKSYILKEFSMFNFSLRKLGNIVICFEVINIIFFWGLEDEKGIVRFFLGIKYIRSNL